ncbi:MAG TPA: hypothetical protein VK575_11730 [Gemmatimonadaceae bacterium]|nr:hypothetical protein [Gemmatimonadaceae bacterium]
MAVELAPISGAIELKDEYTNVLGIVAKELFTFSEGTKAHFAGIAVAGGLVAATFVGIATAAKQLGERGADILDVEGTLRDFAGGVGEAAKVMEELRSGTQDTIGDFELAKNAAHLLSAGVRLTADDFGTLSQAAFVLQNRGLGGTKEMLDIVSDAMVTGRTRALAMALGVVDVGDAEADYAKKLGVSASMLSDTAKVEAKRIAILGMLETAVQKAGVQEKDFGERLEAARTFIVNWVDEVAKAVAASPVLAAGMDAVGKAINDAFGGDSQASIETTTSLIENTAIVATDFALGLVEAARVVHAVWSGLQTVILGVMTAISETVSLIPGMTDAMREWTKSLGEQTAEAAKGVMGTSEFDKTLDKLGGTIFKVRDAMIDAKNATKDHSQTLDIASENTKKLEALQGQLAAAAKARAIDAGKLADMEKKSLETIKGLTAEHYANVTKMTGTSYDAQKAAIEANFKKQVEVLDKLNPAYQAHYAALRQAADDALTSIGAEWESVRDKSVEALRQKAEAARETYRRMVASGLTFSRDVLVEQLDLVRELEDAARGMGETYEDAFEKAAAAAAQVSAEAEKQKKAAEEILKANRAQGGSMNVTRANIDGLAYYDTTGRFVRIPKDIAEKMAERGFSAEEIILAYRTNTVDTWVPQGPRITGFAEGGTVDVRVGERGPEVARIPLGTQVFPGGVRPPDTGGTTLVQYLTIELDGKVVAKSVNRSTIDGVKSTRQMRIA